jgi:tetratricopeptide (TPR) repeat protein
MNHFQRVAAQNASQLFQQAFAAHRAGKLDEAEALYRKVLRTTPGDAETLYLLGTICSQSGKLNEAVTHLQKALEIKPDYPEALNNMGLTLTNLRKHKEAVNYYTKALDLKPDYADAYNNFGNVLEILGMGNEAESFLRKALELDPELADAHYNLGLVLRGKDRFEEAAQCFLRGIQLKPSLDYAYNDLGQIYKLWGRLEDALKCFDKAVALNPDSHSTRNNRGATLEELGRLDEALQEYERACALSPELLVSKWNQAFLFLRQGVLDRGWELHELRFDTGQVERRFTSYPEWDGSSLQDKTILLYAEQGLGDEILFASCFSEMIAMAKHCVIECEPRLAPLFSRSFPSATVVDSNRTDTGWLLNVPKIDVQVAAGSLPRFLRPTVESFASAPAYLVADERRVNYWQARLAELGTGPKVGICWRSGLLKGERLKHYSSLTQWGDIFDVPGVQFVNLQYGECADELREAEDLFGIGITVFPELDLRNAIDDSAALMASLDLVISAGTSVSEIAGAVGVDVFRLDKYGRQMDTLGTDRMPWHPAMTLFCQPSPGDWDTPLALIGEAVREKAAKVNVPGATDTLAYIPAIGDVEVAVNGSLDDLSTYVLKETRGWFDAEHAFVFDIVKPGMCIVDVGAGVGAYALPLASRIEGGAAWAFTRTAVETSLLRKSVMRNRLDKHMRVAIAGREPSLDTEMDRYGLDNIAFVRVLSEMCTTDLLSRSARFFSKNSPLVMFGVKPGAEFDAAAADWFKAQGYGLYRLVPGLGVLVPFVQAAELDSYALNLFACKPDRAALLERDGILAGGFHTLDSVPGALPTHWVEYMKDKPYAASTMDGWAAARPAEWEVYWMGLNLFALAQTKSNDAARRYACLQTAVGVLTMLVKECATLPRLLSLTRMLIDMGNREMAVNLLNQICELLHSGLPPTLDEPCLALSDTFAEMRPTDRADAWIVAMVLERREALRAFSTFFTGQESLAALEEVNSTGAAGGDTVRRIALIKARFGIG